MSEIKPAPMFCECDFNPPHELRSTPDGLVHTCGFVVECEFSYLDEDVNPPHVATQVHVDYKVCDEHLGLAVDNVSCR